MAHTFCSWLLGVALIDFMSESFVLSAIAGWIADAIIMLFFIDNTVQQVERAAEYEEYWISIFH